MTCPWDMTPRYSPLLISAESSRYGTDDICVDPAVEHSNIVAISQSRSLCCLSRSISLDGGVSKFSDDHPDGSAGFPVLAIRISIQIICQYLDILHGDIFGADRTGGVGIVRPERGPGQGLGVGMVVYIPLHGRRRLVHIGRELIQEFFSAVPGYGSCPTVIQRDKYP